MSFDAIPEDSRESHPCDCSGNIILIGEKWCRDSCDFEKLDIAKKTTIGYYENRGSNMNDKIRALLSILKDVRKYIQAAHHDAEARHDNYGEFYMDGGLWMTMVETEALLKIIDSFDIKDNI